MSDSGKRGRAAGRVLLVDDNVVFARALVHALEHSDLEVRWLTHGSKLPGAIESVSYDVAVLESVMPGLGGARMLEILRDRSPRTRVLVLAASPSLATAIEVMKGGAADYLVKPLSPEVVAGTVRTLLADAGEDSADRRFLGLELLGNSEPMREIQTMVGRVAGTDAPVLLCGESGTGKELVARLIHDRSPRAGGAFLGVNCSALAAGVLESELFGHVRGAFTGARSRRRGLFEEADRGTLLLDEIAATSLTFQTKLLRVLEDGEVRPLGSSESVRTSTRIIAASNVDLKDAVRASRFRADLYYRLNVVSLTLPPLRERSDDIDLLAVHFAGRVPRDLGQEPPELTAGFLACFRRYHWPGNVRELCHAVERAVLLADGDRLEARHVPEEIRQLHGTARVSSYAEAKRDAISRFTASYLQEVLRETGGNISRASSLARVPRQTLHRLIRAHLRLSQE